MGLIDEYQGDDDKSMAANNTSAFICRTTDRRALSRHALVGSAFRRIAPFCSKNLRDHRKRP
jgi:hypothetical protein